MRGNPIPRMTLIKWIVVVAVGGVVGISKELTNHMLFYCKILKSETELKPLTQLTLMTALCIELF